MLLPALTRKHLCVVWPLASHPEGRRLSAAAGKAARLDYGCTLVGAVGDVTAGAELLSDKSGKTPLLGSST